MATDLTPAEALRVMRDSSAVMQRTAVPSWHEIRMALAEIVPMTSPTYDATHEYLSRALQSSYIRWHRGWSYQPRELYDGINRAIGLAEQQQ